MSARLVALMADPAVRQAMSDWAFCQNAFLRRARARGNLYFFWSHL